MENEIITEVYDFNKKFIFNVCSKNITFYTNPNSLKCPDDSEGIIAVETEDYQDYISLGIGNKEQYLNLCKLIKEINNESKTD